MNRAVFCSLLLKSYYPCQLSHAMAHKLNIVQIHQRIQQPAEKMPHSKKKREKMLHQNQRNALRNTSALIEYDGRVYPGFVEDADLAQVYVNCMHSIGKAMLNCFYWPRLFPDLNWYAATPVSYTHLTLPTTRSV